MCNYLKQSLGCKVKEVWKSYGCGYKESLLQERDTVQSDKAANFSEKPLTFSFRVKLKHNHYKPEQALRFSGVWGSQIPRNSAHESGKFVSPTQRMPLPPWEYSWYSFLLESKSNPRVIVRPEGLCQLNIPVKQSGFEPATFQLVAQYLNQLRNRRVCFYIL